MRQCAESTVPGRQCLGQRGEEAMKTKGIIRGIILFAFFLILGAPRIADAASYTWKTTENGNMQCYKNGKKLVKSKWVDDRHLNADGYMDCNTWVVKNVNGVKTSVFVGNDGRLISNFKAGWQKINKKYYYYTEDGKLVTGWIKVGNKMYYADRSTKARVKGLVSISGKLYYFSSGGVLQKDKEITYMGRKYTADERGVCTPEAESGAPGANMLFFLTFESGSAAYNQVGGDYGNACGAYQFDNRYSLLPFVKYAYAQNRTLCKEFKKFAKYKVGTKLKSNQSFYKAWNTIYARNPKLFAQLQDDFAKQEYYDPVERMLALSGIDLASRPDVVKGAVYSYSIQHGQTAAVNAVRACKLKASMTDEKFLKKLYDYRMKSYPAYRSRYSAEYALALRKL